MGKKKKIETLKKNYQFQKVYKSGNFRSTKYTVLGFLRNKELHNRLGVSVSKKVGISIVRHRLKRYYLEAYRTVQNDLKEGYDLVIIARRGAENLNYGDILAELRKIFARGKLFK